MIHNRNTRNAEAIAGFISSSKRHVRPHEVLMMARMCLVDTIGVAIGAHRDDAACAVRRVVENWGSAGRAQVLLGGKTTAALAALVNATLAHCLDFDDTHAGATAHLSGPTWSAALAVGLHVGAGESDILGAFITGFETAARLGSDGFGRALHARGFHPTGILGCVAAAAATSVLLGLDHAGIRNALGTAATQATGLTASFGTMAKPFQAGKAAMSGVLSAELAAEGFVAAQDLFEAGGALASTLVQDHVASIRSFECTDQWEILNNSFKPYASCLLTHPVIDVAREVSLQIDWQHIVEIKLRISPLCAQTAGELAPNSGVAGKFSAAYCAALGLTGSVPAVDDFTEERVHESALQEIMHRVRLIPEKERDWRSARIEIRLANGASIAAETPLAFGNPGNPMSLDDMSAKFKALVGPVLGARKCAELFSVLLEFDSGALNDYVRLVGRI